jgi:antitoxin YefM
MPTVSYTDFRKNLAYFLTLTEDDCEEVVVTRGKGRKAVLLSLDEFLSLQETAYLLSSQKNRKHLEKSLKEAKTGKIVDVDL